MKKIKMALPIEKSKSLYVILKYICKISTIITMCYVLTFVFAGILFFLLFQETESSLTLEFLREQQQSIFLTIVSTYMALLVPALPFSLCFNKINKKLLFSIAICGMFFGICFIYGTMNTNPITTLKEEFIFGSGCVLMGLSIVGKLLQMCSREKIVKEIED